METKNKQGHCWRQSIARQETQYRASWMKIITQNSSKLLMKINRHISSNLKKKRDCLVYLDETVHECKRGHSLEMQIM